MMIMVVNLMKDDEEDEDYEYLCVFTENVEPNPARNASVAHGPL